MAQCKAGSEERIELQNLRWNLPADKEGESRLGGRIAASVVNYRQDNAQVGRRRSGFNCNVDNAEQWVVSSTLGHGAPSCTTFSAAVQARSYSRRTLKAAVFIRVSLLPCPSNRHRILDNASPALFIGSPSIHQQLCSSRNNRATLPAFMSTDNSPFFEQH